VTSHPTASEIFNAVRVQYPKVSLGTVYRNLEVLAAEGLIQRLNSPGAEARFDGNVACHHHLHCSACGRVDDLMLFSRNLLEDLPDDPHGYKVTTYNFEVIGLCPSCQEKYHRDRCPEEFPHNNPAISGP
jgi:Fur family ferric uptake transcriptional regulator